MRDAGSEAANGGEPFVMCQLVFQLMGLGQILQQDRGADRLAVKFNIGRGLGFFDFRLVHS